MARKIPPYFKPADRKNYCLPACVGMVVAHFENIDDVSSEKFKEKIDRLSGFDPKLAEYDTSPYRALHNLIRRGYEGKLVEEFDNREFSKKGFKYWNSVYKKFSPETVNKEFSKEIDEQAEIVKETLKLNPNSIENKFPTAKDLEKLLKGRYLVICSVDNLPLQDYIRKTYHPTPPFDHRKRPHGVLVYSLRDDVVEIHDPFFIKNESMRIPIDLFDRSIWIAYCSGKAGRKLRYMLVLRRT